jgi:hypothetical protein
MQEANVSAKDDRYNASEKGRERDRRWRGVNREEKRD